MTLPVDRPFFIFQFSFRFIFPLVRVLFSPFVPPHCIFLEINGNKRERKKKT